MRLQLMDPKGNFMGYTFNQMLTMHGTVMVWLVLIPLVTGSLGNLVMPLQIGARDVAFLWLNILSFWLVPVAGLILFSSFFVGAPSAGWTEHPPISTQQGAGSATVVPPWRSLMISSPAPYYNFRKIPIVLDRPYDFTQPIPYRYLDEENDPYPVPSEAVLPRALVSVGA
jgi:heme/copper-type cytochrome/quinol oxidase subunit 1